MGEYQNGNPEAKKAWFDEVKRKESGHIAKLRATLEEVDKILLGKSEEGK